MNECPTANFTSPVPATGGAITIHVIANISAILDRHRNAIVCMSPRMAATILLSGPTAGLSKGATTDRYWQGKGERRELAKLHWCKLSVQGQRLT